MRIECELWRRRISVRGEEIPHEERQASICVGKPVKVLDNNLLRCPSRLPVRQEQPSPVDRFWTRLSKVCFATIGFPCCNHPKQELLTCRVDCSNWGYACFWIPLEGTRSFTSFWGLWTCDLPFTPSRDIKMRDLGLTRPRVISHVTIWTKGHITSHHLIQKQMIFSYSQEHVISVFRQRDSYKHTEEEKHHTKAFEMNHVW
jgi:hypothetical protein